MTRQIPPISTYNLLHGIWFVFEHPTDHVAIWLSSITGMQEVFVNGVCVVRCRFLCIEASHHFLVREVPHSITIRIEKYTRGAFVATLLRLENTIDVLATESQFKSSSRRNFFTVVMIGSWVLGVWENQSQYWYGAIALTCAWVSILYWPNGKEKYRVVRRNPQ